MVGIDQKGCGLPFFLLFFKFPFNQSHAIERNSRVPTTQLTASLLTCVNNKPSPTYRPRCGVHYRDGLRFHMAGIRSALNPPLPQGPRDTSVIWTHLHKERGNKNQQIPGKIVLVYIQTCIGYTWIRSWVRGWVACSWERVGGWEGGGEAQDARRWLLTYAQPLVCLPRSMCSQSQEPRN